MRLAPDQHVILGPPGCGKTTELLRLVERHLDRGVPPTRIAYFSFTRKAVEVARSRAMERFSLIKDDLPFFRTVHSMVFTLNGYARSDVLQHEHYKEISEWLGISFARTRLDDSTGLPLGAGEGDKHLFIDGLSRARRVPLLQQWEESNMPDLDFRAVERTVTAVTRYKQRHGLVDFTDMLEQYDSDGFPLDIDVAFVDEAQDLSRLQWLVLQRLLATCPTLYIAGDDDQAIYKWSGADVALFLTLAGQRRVLAQSWRCAEHVHHIANAISSRITSRIEKQWASRPVPGTVEYVHSVESFDFTQLQGPTLLLARNAYHLTPFIEQLRLRGLTYRTQYGAHSVQRAHASAIYAYTRLMRGQTITGAEARCIYEQLRVGVGVARGHKQLDVDSAAQLTERELREHHGLLARGPWYEALDGIAGRDLLYYRGVLRGGGNLLAEPEIQVNTIHGVKGGEAENVVVCPDMASQSFRHLERSPDDEHRVAYVAVSRARSKLFLLRPATNYFYPYTN